MIEIVIEFVGFVFGELFCAFFGALVGVLWPPKSAEWARWQRVGIGIGLLALIAFALAGVIGKLHGWTSATFWAVVIGSVLFLAYLIAGNLCRRFHETELAKEASK